jgi:hypothetical protein
MRILMDGSMSDEQPKKRFRKLSKGRLLKMSAEMKRARLVRLVYAIQPDSDQMTELLEQAEDLLLKKPGKRRSSKEAGETSGPAVVSPQSANKP